ncbi:hypothetical protein [Streptomyces pseudovenezuelae]|uniref:Uncharacterized protein n=1 Tax=Streptomyces pseudovenezuelae TaxID=67350 RepID=A0ABZ1WMX2_9ACTN|nr:hypothetical protein [Streptomyces pseudovenezuelae]
MSRLCPSDNSTRRHGPGQGRRVLTLLPEQHICVVRADRVEGVHGPRTLDIVVLEDA